MEKNIKYIVLAFCAIFIAFSCEKESAVAEHEMTASKSVRTITLEFPSSPDSKISLAADGKTAWEAGDEILIHGAKVGHSGDTYYSRVITLAEDNIFNDGKKAIFELDEIDAKAGWSRSGYGATLFAMYPASSAANYSDGEYWYYTTPFKNTNTLLLAGTNNENIGEDDVFTFKFLSGVMSFVISEGDYDSYVFTGNGGSEVVAYDIFSCRIDTESSFGDKNKIPYDGTSGGIGYSGRQTILSGTLKANGVTNYIYFPGGVNLSAGFTIKFLKEGNIVKTLSTDTGKNIGMGEYLNLGDVTSHLKTYTASSDHNATTPAITGAVDLSASGSANCYIVDGSDAANAGKVYKFKAYQGNSTNNVGAISSVELLWETWNNNRSDTPKVSVNSVIAAVDYDKQSGNDYYEICFKMPETLHAGNALIAAKNAGGNILWSWHIWVPATTVNPVDASKICGVSLMDRNLGALIVTPTGKDDKDVDVKAPLESFGMMYQWGRKDPFPGAGEDGKQYPAASRVAGTQITMAEGTISMDYAKAHPTEYGKSDNDWLNTTDDSRWASTKTINDPCPPGYKIPYGVKDDKPLWANKSGSSIDAAVTAAGLDWTVSTTGYWIEIKDGDNVVSIPLAGYVEENGSSYYITHATDRAAWWCIANTTSKYHVNLRTSGYYKYESTKAARGCAIRCAVIPAE